jgi:hypothetical protein
MDVMDGGADNSSPLIKPPSYRFDLHSKGLRMKYAVLAVIATGLLVGLRRFSEASLGRKPDR